jgi:hypothetical protein
MKLRQLNPEARCLETYVSFVVTKISSLGIPLSLTAFPTASSLPYPYAVSICRYPICTTIKISGEKQKGEAAYFECLRDHLVRLWVIARVGPLAHP